MSRLRQLNPQNYKGSGTISDEFENVIRYLNAAEYGNQTLAELLDRIFDDNGLFSGVVELRLDADNGLQYRVGEYSASETETGWQTLAALSDLRGQSGINAGEIGDPIFYGRADITATASQTVFDYSHTATDELIVFLDGVLQRPGVGNDYTNDPAAGSAGQITFASAMTGGEVVSVYKVRAEVASGYTRQDTLTSADSQTVFPYVHDASTKVQVYLNGILQREGGAYDYVTSSTTNTITFTTAITAGNLVTFITVENPALTAVTGLMLEEAYVDPQTGLILFSKLAINDGDIAQAKVSGLTSALATKAKITVNATEPSSPLAGELWLDTSEDPDALKFYDGSTWIRTTPLSSLPSFGEADAKKQLRVNAAGNGLEFAAQDLSSVLPVSQKGASNGVASLDSNGKLTPGQRPTVATKTSKYYANASPANGTVMVERIWKRNLNITGMSIQTSAGTCTVQIVINGVAQGAAYTASSVTNDQSFSSAISVDASVDPRSIQLTIGSVSSAANLEVILTYDENTI